MKEPDWDLYRSLLAVLDRGSLSAAARLLGLSQPTLGHHIAALETALGAPLFTRSPKGLVPTETVLALRPHAEAMASAAAALRRTASGGADAPSGTVRITASEMVGTVILPAMIADLRWAHPGIAIELSLSDRSEDLLRQEADIAIRMTRPLQGSLLARKIGEIGLGFHASPAYLAREGMPKHLGDLSHHTLIGPDRDISSLRGVIPAGLALTAEMFAIRVDSHVAHLALVQAGAGIGVCQHGIAAAAGLVPVLPDLFRPMLPVWLVCHEDLRASRRIAAVFEVLGRALTDYVARDAQAMVRTMPPSTRSAAPLVADAWGEQA